MVSRPIALLVALLGVWLVPLTRAELDLSPQLEPFELEGVKMSQLSFGTGTNQKATYQPPGDWKYAGGKDHLELRPEAATGAKAQITLLPPEPVLALDPEGCKKLTENTVRALPEGSEKIKIESEQLDPLQISGKHTYLIELSYTCYGERYISYCLFLDRKPEPMRFQLTCRESDYQALREEFRRSLYSWQNL